MEKEKLKNLQEDLSEIASTQEQTSQTEEFLPFTESLPIDSFEIQRVPGTCEALSDGGPWRLASLQRCGGLLGLHRNSYDFLVDSFGIPKNCQELLNDYFDFPRFLDNSYEFKINRNPLEFIWNS